MESTSFHNKLIITKISNLFKPYFHLLQKKVMELSVHPTSRLHSLLKLVTLLYNVLNVPENSSMFPFDSSNSNFANVPFLSIVLFCKENVYRNQHDLNS